MGSSSVVGMGDLRQALDRLPKAVETAIEAAVNEEARDVQRDARRNARRDSGDLRSIILAEVDGLAATVAPRPERSKEPAKDAAIKANVNEFGRQSDPGQPFMVPAAEVSRKRWPKRAEAAVRKAVE